MKQVYFYAVELPDTVGPVFLYTENADYVNIKGMDIKAGPFTTNLNMGDQKHPSLIDYYGVGVDNLSKLVNAASSYQLASITKESVGSKYRVSLFGAFPVKTNLSKEVEIDNEDTIGDFI